jgi:hypothetical protein
VSPACELPGVGGIRCKLGREPLVVNTEIVEDVSDVGRIDAEVPLPDLFGPSA